MMRYISNSFLKISLGIIVGSLSFSCESPKEAPVVSENVTEKTAHVNQLVLSKKQIESIGFEFGSVKIDTVSDLVKSSGRVALPPVNLATVSLPISGKIKMLRGLPGQAVKKGEVLATLESFEFIQIQQDYLQNYSQLLFQEKEMERQKSLNTENVGARKNYEQALANYNSTRALIQSLEAKLNILGIASETVRGNGVTTSVKVLAPVNGYITNTSVNLGKEVTAGQSIFEIADKSHLHFELTIYEKDASKVREGQSVTILLNGNAKPILAQVKLVGRILEGDSRSLVVHAYALNKIDEAILVPGAYVQAQIKIGRRNAEMVPAAAVVRKGATGFVYFAGEKNEFVRLPIEIGVAKKGELVEMIRDTTIDLQRLVTKGAYQLDAEFVKRADTGEE